MTKEFQQCIEEEVSKTLHEEINISEVKQVYGGDINSTFIITTNKEKYFVKQNEAINADIFRKEANALRLLHDKSVLKIPEPVVYGIHQNKSFLVMECLERSKPTAQTWKSLGEGLADLHHQTQSQFGFEEDNYIGSLKQVNHLSYSWAEFYTEQHLLPFFKRALLEGKCTTDDVKKAENLAKKITQLFPNEAPALLHGDLWSGNTMACSNEKVAIYDPAAYYGHREMDIAMTLLFGGFDPLFYLHYNNLYPLQNGWQSRVDLCQLYPLLVHLILFGYGYYNRVKTILDKYC